MVLKLIEETIVVPNKHQDVFFFMVYKPHFDRECFVARYAKQPLLPDDALARLIFTSLCNAQLLPSPLIACVTFGPWDDTVYGRMHTGMAEPHDTSKHVPVATERRRIIQRDPCRVDPVVFIESRNCQVVYTQVDPSGCTCTRIWSVSCSGMSQPGPEW
jgi:hypothetical protein